MNIPWPGLCRRTRRFGRWNGSLSTVVHPPRLSGITTPGMEPGRPRMSPARKSGARVANSLGRPVPGCAGESFVVLVQLDYGPAVLDLEDDEPGIALEDCFTGFRLYATCAA